MSKYLDYDGLSHFKDKCDNAYADTLGTGYVKAAFTPDLNVGYGFSGFTQWAFNIPITEDLTLAITWIDTSTNTTYSCIGVTYNDGSEYGITVNAMTEVNVNLSNYVTITEDETITGEKTFNTVNAKVGNFTGSGINVNNIDSIEGSNSVWIISDTFGVLSSKITTNSDIMLNTGITISSVGSGNITLTDGTNSTTFGDLISGGSGSSSSLYEYTLELCDTLEMITLVIHIISTYNDSITDVSNFFNNYSGSLNYTLCVYNSSSAGIILYPVTASYIIYYTYDTGSSVYNFTVDHIMLLDSHQIL